MKIRKKTDFQVIYISSQVCCRTVVLWRKKMLQGVQFAIHVSHLCELRAESAGEDISISPYHPHPYIQMCRKKQCSATISSSVNLCMPWEIGGPEGKGQRNINLTCRWEGLFHPIGVWVFFPTVLKSTQGCVDVHKSSEIWLLFPGI